MERKASDAAGVRTPPPLVFLGAVILGVLLHEQALPAPLPLSDSVRIAGAALGGLAGIGLIGGAIGLFARTGQDPKPWKPTPEIVTSGIYRHTRNPMYVGMAFVQAAIGIGLANGWVLALIPPVLILIFLTAIRHEEAYLERKFGDRYNRYRSTVRRWL